MKKNYLMACIALATISQAKAQDTLQMEQLQELTIKAVRANKETPVSYSSMNKEEIKKRNLGQDIPALMQFMPSVVFTSDTGNGVGYTGIRVRGTDPTRVNVTLNGIPYNDSESQGTFWVNISDFASSLQSLQLQRGVGTSTNGSGAFGATLNLETDGFGYVPSGEISSSFGSYNTRKHTVKYATGLMNNGIDIQGRLSQIYSDGYIDRASSKLQSYFLQGSYVAKGSLVKALVFGGKEKTYQAWDGVSSEQIEKYGRRFNAGGKYTDKAGNMQFYNNHTDNYKQDHYQLHWNQKWSSEWNTNVALHYTKGFGYYESFREDEKLSKYKLQAATKDSKGEEIKKANVIDRKYLDNYFYGVTFSGHRNFTNASLIVGGAANSYHGKHFGELLWVGTPANYSYKQLFYNNNAEKTDANIYAKFNYDWERFNFFIDLQYRNVQYQTNGEDTGKVNDSFDFFNPKAGITYRISENQSVYFSYAQANREPSRADYKSGNPKPEQLHDFELGWRFANAKNEQINMNFYYMSYNNQLVLTGALDDVGAPIRTNSGKSYRAGVEIEAQIPFLNKFVWKPNLTLSTNKNIDFFTEFDGKLQKLGNTTISFSPNIVAANNISYQPVDNLEIALLTKYVGEQFMSNTEAPKSKLDAYYTNDLVIGYQVQPKKYAKNILFSLMLNNILNTEYISNGYYYTYDDDWTTPGSIKTIEGTGYYPQATFNFLVGINISF